MLRPWKMPMGVSFRMTIPRGMARHWRLVLWLCAAQFMCTQAAFAFRPFDGTDASIAEPHLFELELSPMSYLRTGDERALVLPNVTFNYGTGASWEIVLEGQRVMGMETTDAPRLEDLTLATKKVLREGILQDQKGASIATEAAINFPASNERGAGVSGSLIVSRAVARALVHLNLELGRTREREFERFASAIIEGPENWPVRPVAELAWQRDGEDTPERGILGGVIWQTRHGMAMDLAVRTSMADERSVEVRAGFTWKLHVDKGI